MKKPKSKLWEWQMKLGAAEAKCYKCGRTAYLTVDHIIPCNILISLNLKEEQYEWDENYEIMCAACNKIKGGNLDISNPKTLPLLQKAIEMAKGQLAYSHPIQTFSIAGSSNNSGSSSM